MTKIMIVDDEQDLREMLELMLHKEGFKTDTAENGSELLEKIDTFQPDLITLDVMMPGMTTSKILEKLKDKKSKPKIILLTVVRYSEEEKEKIYKMGNVVDYITKPFELDDLMNVIHKQVMKNNVGY
ncbi:MAG: response regulator, partial [Candidatus Thermoplasmatota archaeon]|nr:response regulator [Candidatus Thermoplasmatota archaeon]